MEEGAIRCEDAVPPNSLMRLAQIQLGCDGVAARERAERQAEAGRQAKASEPPRVIAPLAVPPGFVRDSNLYRIMTQDRLLAFYDASSSEEIRLEGVTSNARGLWRMCQGPQSNGETEHIFIGMGMADGTGTFLIERA
ncbi:hypothetical protein [Nonomuraea sp. KM90]|uniref:hypothetical protein n=1 Tax=Nonomuraea sp. KM90 TaxID=3457428 RepID=UPI003FCCE8B7